MLNIRSNNLAVDTKTSNNAPAHLKSWFLTLICGLLLSLLTAAYAETSFQYSLSKAQLECILQHASIIFGSEDSVVGLSVASCPPTDIRKLPTSAVNSVLGASLANIERAETNVLFFVPRDLASCYLDVVEQTLQEVQQEVNSLIINLDFATCH